MNCISLGLFKTMTYIRKVFNLGRIGKSGNQCWTPGLRKDALMKKRFLANMLLVKYSYQIDLDF
ncbi:MAG: hypothetical protein CL833_01400 [Crocinitomicaceae bacterium]|nr:hypothetical protein [Crocinitomicaceae bacterium]